MISEERKNKILNGCMQFGNWKDIFDILSKKYPAQTKRYCKEFLKDCEVQK